MLRAAALFIVVTTLALFSTSADAYPWLIKHQYESCTPCHADPAGAGLLTEYGRAQSDLLLRTRFGGGVAEEPDSTSGLLWGAFSTPEWLLLGGSYRGAGLYQKNEGQPSTTKFILMQADLRAQVTALDRFRASGSIGYAHEVTDAVEARVTTRDEFNVVSREHWLGVDLGEEKQFLLRAGRINLPYGIRGVEHTLFARRATSTSINDDQQHGVALYYQGSWFRGELMGIAGNFQIGPDDYRKRGYAGFIEVPISTTAVVGLSSMLTYSAFNPDRLSPTPLLTSGQALTLRYAPWEPLALLGQASLVVQGNPDDTLNMGTAAFLQADYEPLQGLHAIVTGETWAKGDGSDPWLGAWLGINWFFWSHMDIRIDGSFQRVSVFTGQGFESFNGLAALGQFHFFL